MTRHDPGLPLRYMLDYATEALDMARGMSLDGFYGDRKSQLALTRLLEVIGEAASRVRPEDRETCPRIPWRDIIALRNRLIHGYDGIDLRILWNILGHDLPLLIRELTNCLGALDHSEDSTAKKSPLP